MSRSKSSVDKRDIYYRKCKSEGYRARSAFKLLHLDEEFDLFTGVYTAVDLCAAPGSWSQVLSRQLRSDGDTDGVQIVSIDLQPMAPLPNTTILHADITLPSTVPLVMKAMRGKQADLVICDGAPDVTGLHDLDAYLHSQLLLAGFTLSLPLLAPHATLLFKIFLSPMDPQAALLTSQLRPFFPTTKDLHGRRGGVWVRKPRSSRKGSGEAFIVCRNFDPSALPFALDVSDPTWETLEQRLKGSLTLDSFASVLPVRESSDWEQAKGFVSGGDLSAWNDPIQ